MDINDSFRMLNLSIILGVQLCFSCWLLNSNLIWTYTLEYWSGVPLPSPSTQPREYQSIPFPCSPSMLSQGPSWADWGLIATGRGCRNQSHLCSELSKVKVAGAGDLGSPPHPHPQKARQSCSSCASSPMTLMWWEPGFPGAGALRSSTDDGHCLALTCFGTSSIWGPIDRD